MIRTLLRGDLRRRLGKEKPAVSGGFLRADARTRTGDPFITRSTRETAFALLERKTRRLSAAESGHFCRVGDTFRDTLSDHPVESVVQLRPASRSSVSSPPCRSPKPVFAAPSCSPGKAAEGWGDGARREAARVIIAEASSRTAARSRHPLGGPARIRQHRRQDAHGRRVAVRDHIVSTFNKLLQPIGQSALTQGPPVAA